MVDIPANTALLIALGNAFNAARANAPRGNATAGIPGLSGSAGEGDGTAVTPGLGPSGGVPGGSVPGTATTGDAVMDALLGGDANAGDPVAQQVAAAGIRAGIGGAHEPGERGDLGAGVTGGDILTFASVLGGPAAIPSILGNLVASDVLGLPPTTSGVLNNLIALQEGGEAGDFGARASGGDPFSFGPAGGVTGARDFGSNVDPISAILGSIDFGGSGGGLSFNNDRDDDRLSGGPSSKKEPTTGRVAGPV